MPQPPLGSEFNNPISASPGRPRQHPWSYIEVGGVRSPGAISVDGIRGFERESEWEKKKGKGTQGATLTLVQRPPAEGSIEFLLWLERHFAEWKDFRSRLNYQPSKRGTLDAFKIYHPSLADLGISSVVTAKISPIYHKGRNLYSVTVDFIEWLPPPPRSIVKTPAKATGTDPKKTPGSPNKAVQDAQQEFAAAVAENAATPFQ